MPDRFQMEIRGNRALEAKLRGLAQFVQRDVRNELKAAAFDMNADAIRNITRQKIVDQGIMRASQQVVWNNAEHGYTVANTAIWSVFMEFGTKKYVSVPAEWSEYAQQFKGYKGGTVAQFRSNIEDWVKRKGISWTDKDGRVMSAQEISFIITQVILQNGLKPRPFMWPAYQRAVKDLPKKINDAVNRILR